MRNLIRSSIVALSLVVFSATAVAATTVPFTFTAGTPATASEVNANFQALATAIDTLTTTNAALTTQIAKLDGTTPVTAADMAGTYKVQIYNTQIGSDTTTLSAITNKVYSIVGTMTLLANGTGTWIYTGSGSYDQINGSTGLPNIVYFNDISGSQSITWTLTGSLFSTSLGGGPGCQLSMGGRLCVATSEILGESSLFLLTRIQ